MSVSYGYIIGFEFEDIGSIDEQLEVKTKYDPDTGKPYEVSYTKRTYRLGNKIISYDDYNDSDLHIEFDEEEDDKPIYVGLLIYLYDEEPQKMGDLVAKLCMKLAEDFEISKLETNKIKIFSYWS